MTDKPASDRADMFGSLLSAVGLLVVAAAQVSNMILARAVAGTIPPFAIAFVRWTLIALALAPFVASEIKAGRLKLAGELGPIFVTGFLGMFLCGGPVYAAGETTGAINIALIMSLSPVIVTLIAWLRGLERIKPLQLSGMGLALAGALFIIARGDLDTLKTLQLARGDLYVLFAMLGWSGYTLLQVRVAPAASFFARIGVFSAAGALATLPVAAWETWREPAAVFSAHAFAAYLFAGIVPGLLAYTGFAWLTGRFGAVRSSLILYLGPAVSAVLSYFLLNEPPHLFHATGGSLILLGVWASLRK
jgi:drug/metabolite transporter (DMT)-like permease